MFTFLIILSAIVQGLVALFVLQKNNKSLTNILFFFLSFFLVIWAVINFLLTKDAGSVQQLTLFCLLMASVVVQNTFFFLFAHTYPNRRIGVKSTLLKLYILLSILALAAALGKLVFTSIDITESGARPVPGPGMALFMLHAGISVFSGLRAIYRHYKKSSGRNKQQFRLIFAGSIILWGIVPVTNFILPNVTSATFFSQISPVYTLAFSSVIAYAIVTTRLFDIRAAVARSVAYMLSLALIGLMYGLILYGLSSLINFAHYTDQLQRAVYIGFALLTAIFFQPLVKRFARLTNKLFYQDAYDPQVFLDELNEVLVANIELKKLLEDTIYVIQQHLKTDFCVFTIRETAYFPRRFVGDKDARFKPEDMEEINSVPAKVRAKVLATDDLEGEENALKRVLDKNNISVMVRLVPTLDYDVQGVGHILFGAKKSGNPYNKQDIQILEIIANELVIAIQNGLRFEEIEKFNATLQDKVDEATRQLRKTNDKLKALDETKDEFISMASHQLRTPLTSVKGYLSMVLEGDAGDISPMQQKLLDQAFNSSQRMVYLIADLLNVSRLRTGKFVIEAIPTNLADVVEGEVHQLTETAKARGLALTYKKPDKFPTLMLDETKIRQVMMNFMDNAIYYAKSNGHVEVTLEETDKTVEFTVKDDGIGVPKSEQHHLFTKFYRAGNAKKARPDGTGLGLFMAKKVIVAQGGALIFHSEEGKGSTFGFSFDKAKLQAQTNTSQT